MKLVGSLAVALIGCLAVPPVVLARWDGKQDNKSEPELEALTGNDLFNEAFDVCVRRAMIERQANDRPEVVGPATADATDYLGVIERIATAQHAGVSPSWMSELAAAHTVKQCQGAFRTFLAAEAPQEPQHPKKVVTPAVPKRTTGARSGDRLEQLPPWLVQPRPD